MQVFDKSLCCRQLRYSGMMETAKIRKAGYPIRYDYKQFIDRFRYLGKNVPPSHKTDCKASTKTICETVFVKGEDYQLGNTKLFLKDVDNEYLEEERSRVLSKYILLIQKVVKGWLCRKKYLRLKAAAIIVQKHWRARGYRSRYLLIKNGYQRLQAVIRSRALNYKFGKIRTAVRGFQAYCKGYVARRHSQIGKIYSAVQLKYKEELELKKSGNRQYQQVAELHMQKRLAELNREYTLKETEREDETNKANELVDDVFEFLKDSGLPSNQTDVKESEAFMVRLVLTHSIFITLSLTIFRSCWITKVLQNQVVLATRKLQKKIYLHTIFENLPLRTFLKIRILNIPNVPLKNLCWIYPLLMM